MENRTDFYFLSFEFNNKTPVFSVTPDFLLQWREGKRKEKLCKTIYRDVMSYTECAQLLNATSLLQSWTKDPFVAATNDSLFGYYGNGTAFNRSVGGAAGDAEIIVPVLPPFVLWQSILIAISLALCIILTIGGNILVLLAFIVDKNIRQPSNYFIASLAATDMLIGTVSMPFFTIYVLMGYWDLGPLLCDLWLSVDYTVCLVSQYTVLLITIDRYCSVKFAAKYRSWRTKNRVLYMVTTTWIVPALLFFTSIFGWEHFVGYRDLQPGECAVQFLKDPIFNTALIIGYYWSTLIVLFILYAGIYKTAYDMQKKSESKQRKMQSMMALSAGAMSGMANRAAGIAALSRTQSTPVSQPDNKVVCVGGVAAPTTQSAPNDAKKVDERFEGKREDAGKDQRNSQHIVVEDNQAKQVSIKSEKSSSPAFDSDDDSTANPPRPEQTNAKRTSLLDIIIHSGMPIHTLGDKAKGAQPQLNCVDEDEERAVRLDPIIADTEPAPPAHLRSTISTDAADTPTHHHHHQTAALAKLLPLLSGKPRPSSLRLDGAYDILVGLDGADLRYMDESSLVVPSPTTTTAGDSSSPSASPARAHTHQPQPNSHLLQSALATSARREASRKKRHRAPIGDASVSEAAKESCSEVSSPVHVSTLPRTIADQRVRVDVVKPTFLQRVRRRLGGGAPPPRVCAPFDGFARQKSKSENRARKALRTISFILGAFAICWTPYHVFALVEGFCATPPCVNGHLYMFSYFLCYANSPLNPFCYAMSNQQFKKTFTRILKGDLHVT